MRELPHTYSCFVCGEANPLGLKLRFETDGKTVLTRFVPKPEHIGFKQTVHGGLIATVFDELMVWSCAVATKRFAYCAELNVRFTQPLRPNEEAVVTAQLVANRRDKIYETQAEMRSTAGVLIASATGKYMPIKDVDVTEMAADFVGDPRAI
jgi:acyl-coenzyme A thioesterase PaaI-like protein